jgi:mono/diheme cytochrome c family protein
MRRFIKLLLLALLPAAALADAPAPETGDAMLAQAKARVQDIATDELAALIERDPTAAVVDIGIEGQVSHVTCHECHSSANV